MQFKHLGICVNSIDEFVAKSGATIVLNKKSFPGQTSCLVDLGGLKIELMEPNGEGTVKKFLEKSGEGMHHISFKVDDMPATVEAYKAAGASVMELDGMVAFVKPKGNFGILEELSVFADGEETKGEQQ